MTKTEEIMDMVYGEMRNNNIDITDENVLLFLLGLQEAWDEMEKPDDHDERMAMGWYKLALSTKIMSLQINMRLALTRK